MPDTKGVCTVCGKSTKLHKRNEAGFKTGIETGIKSMLDLGKYSMEEIAEVFHVSVDKVKAVRNMLI